MSLHDDGATLGGAMVIHLLRLTAAASLLLVTSIDSSGAARAEMPALDSSVVMLRLHMQFGGRSTAASQTSLTLNVGSHSRLSPGPVTGLQNYFTRSLQAGWMLSGRAVFRVGAIDVVQVLFDRANAQTDEATGGVNRRLIWVALGVVGVGATVAALAADDNSDHDCIAILPPPPPAPLPPGACPYVGPYPAGP